MRRSSSPIVAREEAGSISTGRQGRASIGESIASLTRSSGAATTPSRCASARYSACTRRSRQGRACRTSPCRRQAWRSVFASITATPASQAASSRTPVSSRDACVAGTGPAAIAGTAYVAGSAAIASTTGAATGSAGNRGSATGAYQTRPTTICEATSHHSQARVRASSRGR